MKEHGARYTPVSPAEEAAEWLHRLLANDLTRAERRALLRWLKASPVHVAELLHVCRLYSRLRSQRLESWGSETHGSNVIRLAREASAARMKSGTGSQSRSRGRGGRQLR